MKIEDFVKYFTKDWNGRNFDLTNIGSELFWVIEVYLICIITSDRL